MNGYKATTKDSTNRGFHLAEGLNVEVGFSKSRECKKGLWFCTSTLDLLYWAAELGYDHVWFVSIPKHAHVVEYENKSKTDKMLLSNFQKIEDMAELQNENFQLAAVQKHPTSIKLIKNPSLKLQQIAFNGDDDVCDYILSLPSNIFHTKYNLPQEEQMALVRESAWKILELGNPCETAQIFAVMHSAHLIRFIKNPSDAAQIAAAIECANTIKETSFTCEEAQLICVTKCGSFLKYIKNPSQAVQLAALENDPHAIQLL